MVPVNRETSPGYKPIEKIDYIRAEKQALSNGIPLYLIDAGYQDVLRIELLFKAGSRVEPVPLVASATNAMLNEGTQQRSARQIAETFDYYGSYFYLQSDRDCGNLVLFTLSRYLDETLEVLEDIIKNSCFPEKEFSVYVQKRRQQFTEEKSKVKTIARVKLLRSLFGQDHPYGREILIRDFKNLNLPQCTEFYHTHYLPSNCRIIMAGKINDKTFNAVDRHLGQWNQVKTGTSDKHQYTPVSAGSNRIFIEKKNAVQSAIRVGRLLFNKKHPDYIGMQILNTVLGGYFGSRLMKNIREEKGYTYGIGSAIISLHNAGFFTISSEVGIEVCKAALKEIYREITILREKLIPEEEQNLVKNYLLGEILRMFDGPFALAESFKSILEYDLDYSHFEKTIETIRTISSEQLRDLAVKYLDPDALSEVVAGRY